MSTTLEVQDLSLWYFSESSKALDRVSCHFSTEHLNVVLGQNGSGKSSLLKCLAGFQNWNSGDILYKGQSRRIDRQDFNKGVMFVSEDIVLPNYQIQVLKKIYEAIWSDFDQEVFLKVLSIAEIPLQKKPSQLSRGQKVLVQFALGIATQSEVLFIDEVTATLDPYVRRRVAEEIISVQKRRKSIVLLATNIATEFPSIELNTLLLKQGKVFLSGPLSEIRKQFVKIKVQPEFLATNRDVVGLASGDEHIFVGIAKKTDIPSGQNFDLEMSPITLEEIFIYLSERRQA